MDKLLSTSRKRTRIVNGCSSCKERHLKCDLALPRCRQCRIRDMECNREIQLKFRNEPSNRGPIEDDFPPDQVWRTPTNSLRYHDETPEIVRFYKDVSFKESAPPGTIINAFAFEENMPSLLLTPQSQRDQLERYTDKEAELSGVFPTPSTDRQVDMSGVLLTPQQDQSECFTSQETELVPAILPLARFTDREAELMRNFIENMALWLDATDTERHFEIEVARRALSNIMLRYAIFGFSSRHLHRHTIGPDFREAIDYHNKAVQLLIPLLSGPMNALTEENLAAVIILRLDEEMDTKDNQSHLEGGTKLINSRPSFISLGGLGEACAWLCLRQDIYVAIDKYQPLRVILDNFRDSHCLRKNDDMSWANRMVLFLAEILNIVSQEYSVEQTSHLTGLSNDVDEWFQNKPSSFEAIRNAPRGVEKGDRLPVIWMLSSVHVVGLQYYHMAKIVLLLSKDQVVERAAGLKNYQQSRKTEKTIREHLLIILGLATSNPRAENAMFQARHTLAAWGGVLRHPLDQKAAGDFLVSMQKKTGWNTSTVLNSLREVWHEDDE